MSSTVQTGMTGEVERVITEAYTAQALGSGDVPVLGTPALIALLEAAAVKAVAASLEPAQTSVGVHLDVRHLAATPVGMKVRASATLIEIDGRTLVFQVTAHDDVEKVAEGIHRRVVVDRARFEQRAKMKGKPQ